MMENRRLSNVVTEVAVGGEAPIREGVAVLIPECCSSISQPSKQLGNGITLQREEFQTRLVTSLKVTSYSLSMKCGHVPLKGVEVRVAPIERHWHEWQTGAESARRVR